MLDKNNNHFKLLHTGKWPWTFFADDMAPPFLGVGGPTGFGHGAPGVWFAVKRGQAIPGGRRMVINWL